MEDNRPRYKVECPSCGKVMYVCKSIGQEMGMFDFGGGKCINCNLRLNFTFNPNKEEMAAMEWEKWRERKEKLYSKIQI